MSARIPAVVAFAALVAGGAAVFGAALAAEGDGHGDAEPAMHTEEGAGGEEGTHVEPRGAEAAAAEQRNEEGNTGLKIAAALLIGAGAGAVVPLTLLAIGRGEREVLVQRGRADSLRVMAAALSAGAAAIHFAVISEHLRVWWAEGAFFIVAAGIQLLWALAVVIRPAPLLYLVGIAGNAFLALTWVASRTIGVPLGPEAGEPEPVGFIDATATAYEVVAVVALLVLVVRAAPIPTMPVAITRFPVAVGILITPLTALALLDLVQL
jgi:hypothetical protein